MHALETEHGWLRYADLPGEGPAYVMLAGLGAAASASLLPTATHPLLGDRRVVLPDLLGSGWSDRPDAFDYSIDRHADLIAGLLDHLRLRGVALVGHSLGGSIAIALARSRPDLIARLVVAEPNLDPGTGSLSRHVVARSEQAYVERGHRLVIASTEREARGGDANAALFAATLRAWSAQAMHRTSASLLADRSPTFREALVALDLPRTFLEGERSDDDLRDLAEGGVDLRVIEGAGHVQYHDAPDAFAAAVAREPGR